MHQYDKITADAQAIQLIGTSEGLKVIIGELDARMKANQPPDIRDPQWAQLAAYREGEIGSLRKFRDWIIGCAHRKAEDLAEPPPEA